MKHGRWSQRYDCCIRCKRTDIKYGENGLCRKCINYITNNKCICGKLICDNSKSCAECARPSINVKNLLNVENVLAN